MEGPLWVGELRIHCRAEGYIHENTSGDYAFHASFDDIIMRYSGCNQESQRGTISRDWSNWKARAEGHRIWPNLSHKAGPSQPVKMLVIPYNYAKMPRSSLVCFLPPLSSILF